MNKDSADEFLDLLRRDDLTQTSFARAVPLAGGVSCEICLVEDGGDRFVVKRALTRLKVKADWFADVNRTRHEWEYIRYVSRFLPTAVPVLRHYSVAHNYFTMDYLEGFSNWKALLLAGQVKIEHASQAGAVLAQIHTHSTEDPEAKRSFATTPSFIQLRIEPYLLATGAKHPLLRPLFEAEANRLLATRECLVHGDFSPKNILINSGRMVLLDCEVAWYGDPAFDVAFLLNHFFLKALLYAPRDVGMKQMTEKFYGTYQAVRPSPQIESRIGRLLLMLMLARVDGKSPVEYLNPDHQNFVRRFVQANLSAGEISLNYIKNLWFNQLGRLFCMLFL